MFGSRPTSRVRAPDEAAVGDDVRLEAKLAHLPEGGEGALPVPLLRVRTDERGVGHRVSDAAGRLHLVPDLQRLVHLVSVAARTANMTAKGPQRDRNRRDVSTVAARAASVTAKGPQRYQYTRLTHPNQPVEWVSMMRRTAVVRKRNRRRRVVPVDKNNRLRWLECTQGSRGD
eukprot:9491303-Pyramimonas_sp.AAC.2